MPHSSNHQPETDYPELRLPVDGWKSAIPPALLINVEPEMVWLMQEMSKNTQATEWSGQAVLEVHGYVRNTNGKANRAERDILLLKEEVATLKAQLASVTPITNAIATARLVFTNKVFLVILAMSILFLLGFNRDILPAIFKALFG